MKRIVLLSTIVFALLASGCSKYGYVRLNYPLNPAVFLPENVNTIAMVNRSLTLEQDKQRKIFENIVTGEIAGSDRVASDECLRAVYDRMNGNEGISIVIPKTTHFYGTGTREVPELLDWNKVRAVCDSTNADALLVLETFDSNSDIVLSTVTNQVSNIINNGSPSTNLPNQVRMNVFAYWRLYEPKTKKIIDQYQSKSFLSFNAIGPNLTLPPPEALPNTAYAAGQEYIGRFLPSYYSVSRDLYKKGKGSDKRDFKAAFRSAEVANWDGAIMQWERILNNQPRTKNAGRACLNIAVAYEVLGHTEKALEWANKSYEMYNNKLGRDYANILLDRQRIEN